MTDQGPEGSRTALLTSQAREAAPSLRPQSGSSAGPQFVISIRPPAGSSSDPRRLRMWRQPVGRPQEHSHPFATIKPANLNNAPGASFKFMPPASFVSCLLRPAPGSSPRGPSAAAMLTHLKSSSAGWPPTAIRSAAPSAAARLLPAGRGRVLFGRRAQTGTDLHINPTRAPAMM